MFAPVKSRAGTAYSDAVFALLAVAAAAAAQAAEHGEVKPLATKSILVTLAIIVVVGGAVVLAGLGYFTDDPDR